MAAFASAAAQALGIDAMQVITGSNGLGQQLQGALDDQEKERQRKLSQMSGNSFSASAQSLLSNGTGGFGG